MLFDEIHGHVQVPSPSPPPRLCLLDLAVPGTCQSSCNPQMPISGRSLRPAARRCCPSVLTPVDESKQLLPSGNPHRGASLPSSGWDQGFFFYQALPSEKATSANVGGLRLVGKIRSQASPLLKTYGCRPLPFAQRSSSSSSSARKHAASAVPPRFRSSRHGTSDDVQLRRRPSQLYQAAS